MDEIIKTIIISSFSVFASAGFWTYIQKKSDKKNANTQLLVGLARDRIVYLGMSYINKGEITENQFENLYNNLWLPYSNSGGNGVAKRVMDEVHKLPIVKDNI